LESCSTSSLWLVRLAALTIWLLLAAVHPAGAQEVAPETVDQFYRGRVVEIVHEETQDLAGYPQLLQRVVVDLHGRRVNAEHSELATDPARRLVVGERVVVASTESGYVVIDRDRLPALAFLFGLFFAIVVAFTRWRGVASVLGMVISAVVLITLVVPQILAGRSPLATSVAGALIIAVASIYLAHGISRRTSVAVVGTLITLALAGALSVVFVSVARLFGAGTEEAFYLQLGPLERLNLRGLLLGGIILGALGVLDDITTAQAAAVDEIGRANPALQARELYQRGVSVGTEHITALVNTLFLAYAGASLPLFLLFTLSEDQPLWVLVNSEFIAEEIVRTMAGSIALVLAVPITTLLAAYALRRG
jgi:uncharacterized membrane protein